MVSSSKEVLSTGIETKAYKVSELERKFHISVSPKDIESYGDILLSREEIQKIQEWKNTVSELARLKLDSLKGGLKRWVEQVASDLQRSMWIERQKMQEWAESAAQAESTFDSLMETWRRVWGKTWEVIQEWAKKAAETGYMVQLWASLKDFVEKIKSFDIWWAFASLFKGLFGIFSSNEALRVAWEKVEEALSPEEIKKLKQEISQKIETDLTSKLQLHPLIKQKLEEKRNNPNSIPEDKLLKLKKILEVKWHFSIDDIKDILSDEYKQLQEEIKNDPNIKEAVKLQYENLLVKKISNEYWINLEWDKRKKLVELINEKWDENKIDFINLSTKVQNWETITLWETLFTLFDEASEATWFMIQLLTKWIVWVDKFALNIIEWWEKILFWLNWLTGQEISFDIFSWKIENIWEKEKILLLWLLYRKWATLFELLWNLSSFWITHLIESISPSWVSKFELWKASLSNIDNKIKVFGKIESILWWNWWLELLDTARDNLKLLQRNNYIIKVLENVSKESIDDLAKTRKVKELLSKIEWFDTNSIKNLNTLQEIRSAIATKISFNPNALRTSGQISAYLKNDLIARQIEFNRNIGAIIKHQSNVISWELRALKITSKVWELLNSLEIGKNTERLVLQAKTKTWVITKLEAFKKLALEAPDLVKSIFRWLPEIAVLWLAAWTREENESIAEAMIKVAPYLTRVIWPAYMVLSLWWAYKNWEIQWMNVTEAWLWTVFLWMDIAAVSSIIWKNWLSGKTTIEIGKFILKPLTAPIDVAVKSWQAWKTALDIVRAKWSWKEAWKDVIQKVWWKIKSIKNPRAALVIWALAWIWYWIYEIFNEDFDDKYKELVNEWIIDTNWNILDEEKMRQEFSKLDIGDKEALIEIIFISNESTLVDTSYLDFNIEWDNLLVSTDKNPSIWEWVITAEILVKLQSLWIKQASFNNLTTINS